MKEAEQIQRNDVCPFDSGMLGLAIEAFTRNWNLPTSQLLMST